ncbi:MAG TPA: PKD domain-containing protein [Saprospiraceae bacterium]|nr:PKD domain-containing protein [Saprospiraceae bacterium]
MYLHKLLYILFVWIGFQGLMGQSSSFKPIDQKFRKFEILNLPSAQLYSSISAQRSEQKKITLNNWDLTLFDSEIISANYSARIATANGILQERAPSVLALNGYTRQGGRASLTFADNFIYGYVEADGTTYFIEPLYHQTRTPSTDQFIIYTAADILDDEEHTCATDSPEKIGHEHDHGSEQANRAGLCFEVEYAIANDFLMFQAYGTSNGVQNHAIGVLNNVQTNYDDEFADEIQFVIVEQFVSTCSTCDPWTNSTVAENVLNSFTDWAPGGFAFNHDIGSIWTDRDFNGSTIGIAWVGALCTPIQYNALQDFSSNANLKRVMVAHEFGHNFDASHDASGSPHIMAPSVQNTTTWSAVSKTDMQNFYNSVNCLDFCPSVVAPQANFSFNVTTECAPGTVQFTNQSTGTITSYEWEFEGGTPSTSSQQNPTITYNNPGTFSVTLTVSNGPFSNTLEIIDEIVIFPVPDANFTYDINGNEVTFTNTSQAGPNANYTWDFGDGNTSNEENPVHIYTLDGSYTVLLTIDDICGFDNRSKTLSIATAPTANFAANPTSGCGSFEVAFTNTSSVNATIFDWEFPGGSPSSSILPNPIVTYNAPGSYLVSLTASNAQGSDTKTVANFITLLALPTSAFTFTQTGQTFVFTNQATNATSFFWNFGDGNTSTQANPTHTYATSGSYTVTLITGNGNCPTASSTQSISASTAPVSSFTSASSSGCAPFTAAFNNTSANSPSSFLWQFPGGQPNTSTLANPSVVYLMPGNYDVTLITSNINGSDTLTLTNYVQVNTVPDVSFVSSNNELTFSFNNTGTGATSYAWAFGDGNTSTLENPNHTYSVEGSYTVNFSASNACGNVNTSQNVDAYFVPSASVNAASPATICKGNTVSFEDQSTGNVTQRQWLFEGGSPATSTQDQVTVTYFLPGEYNVTLIVGNSSGNDTIVLTDYVKVGDVPQTTITQLSNNNMVTLTNAGSNFTSFSWILPGGSLSTQNPLEFTAQENGIYPFILVNTNACGGTADSFNFVVNAFPEAVFTSTTNGNIDCAPIEVEYETPQVAGNSYQWNFPGGNPETSTDPIVNVTYANAGNFDVNLIVTNNLGGDTILLNNYIVLSTTPTALFEHTVSSPVVDFQFTGSGQSEVIWDFAGLGTSQLLNPSFEFPASGTYPVSLIANNICGSDTVVQNIVIVITGTYNHDLSAYLNYYPNPVDQQLTLQLSGQKEFSKIEVFNTLGQVISANENCSGSSCIIDTKGWISGNYHLRITSGSATAVIRVNKI